MSNRIALLLAGLLAGFILGAAVQPVRAASDEARYLERIARAVEHIADCQCR